MRKKLIDFICLNGSEIVQNPFGNYVIQHMLEEYGAENIKEIIQVIIDNINSLSMQKFSSNIIEKCLDSVTYVIKTKYNYIFYFRK